MSNEEEQRINQHTTVRRPISVGGSFTSNAEAPIPYHIAGRRVSIAVPNNMTPQCFNDDSNTDRFVRPRRARRSSIGASLAAPSKVNVALTLNIANLIAILKFAVIYTD